MIFEASKTPKGEGSEGEKKYRFYTLSNKNSNNNILSHSTNYTFYIVTYKI